MSTTEKELLSALVDSELQGAELDKALALIESDASFRAQWQRYQFNRDLLQGKAIDIELDLVTSVSAALENEPSHQIQKNKSAAVLTFPKQFWKQATGLAVAASVGAIAMMSVISQPQQQLVPVAPIAVAEAPQQESIPQLADAKKANRWTVGEPEVEQRLNDYLVDHHEYAGTSGVFSYARVVAYEAAQ